MLDALVSLLDDGLVAVGVDALATVRISIATMATLLSLPTFALLAFNPALPVRALLPPVFFLLWVVLGAPPLSALYPVSALEPWLSFAQLVIAGLSFHVLRRSNAGSGWLLGPETDRRAFDRAYFVRFSMATVILVPVVVVGLLLGSGALWIRAQTNGFLSMGPRGLYAQERTYVRGSKTVHLVAMAHLGDASFYRGVADAIPREDTIVLAEGVSDRHGLLTEFPDAAEFGDLAATVGLAAQAEIGVGDVESADIDASELSAETVRFLNSMGTALRAETFREGLLLYLHYTETVDPERIEEILREIVEVRNQYVLDQLARSLDSHEHFVVPWGALHMPGLEEGVLALGFTPDETRTRVLISLW